MEKSNSNSEKNKVKSTTEIVKAKDNVENKVNATVTDFKDSVQSAKALVDQAKNLGDSLIESQRIKSKTEIELKRIEVAHQVINKNIDNEYKKQKQAMDKASDVVDAGLESDNIEKIRAGLEYMTITANHNPMADLKNKLDEDLEQDYLDDDFIIEI